MISISRLREELEYPVDDDEEVRIIEQIVVRLWEGLTERFWEERTSFVQWIRPPPRSFFVFLNLWPVTTLTKIEEKTDIPDDDWDLLDAKNYELIGSRKIQKLSSWWKPSVRVTFDGGYTESTIPKDVEKILILQAKFMQKRMRNDNIAIRSQGIADAQTQFEKADFHPLFASLARMKKRKV